MVLLSCVFGRSEWLINAMDTKKTGEVVSGESSECRSDHSILSAGALVVVRGKYGSTTVSVKVHDDSFIHSFIVVGL
jgi:hypothetical protein